MHQILKNFTGLTALTLNFLLVTSAHSAAFNLKENNASLIGTAMAGSAANPNDAASMFNNPASMTTLNKDAIALSLIAISPTFKFSAEQASTPTYGGQIPAQPITDNGGSDGGHNALIPALYALWHVNSDWRLGISITSPFGLRTEYAKNWVGRYYAIKSDLKTININPALAYKINDRLSIGAGVQVQQINSTLSKAIFTGNQTNDTVVTVTGKGWAVGGNAGLYYEPEPGLRLGLSYRSQLKHDVTGSVNYDNFSAVPATIATALAPSGSQTKASMTLPESVTFSISQDIDPQLTIMADLQWTHWSRFNELRVKFPSGGQDYVNHFGYKDTYFVSLGGIYSYNDDWKIKFGVAFDSTPTTTDYRDPRIPDANRLWLATGVEYVNCENLKFSLDYAFVKLSDAKIDLSGPTTPGAIDTVGALRGQYHAYSHVLGIRAHLIF